MQTTKHEFGSILSVRPINGDTIPTNEPALQARLSEALRNYILATSPEAFVPIEYLGACRIQFNFAFQTLSPPASDAKFDARYYTRKGRRVKGLEVNVDVTFGVT